MYIVELWQIFDSVFGGVKGPSYPLVNLYFPSSSHSPLLSFSLSSFIHFFFLLNRFPSFLFSFPFTQLSSLILPLLSHPLSLSYSLSPTLLLTPPSHPLAFSYSFLHSFLLSPQPIPRPPSNPSHASGHDDGLWRSCPAV